MSIYGYIGHNKCCEFIDLEVRGWFFLRAGTWDTKAVIADQLFKLFYLVHIGAMLEPETQVAGVVVVMDFNGLTMKQVGAFSPSFSMRLLSFIQVRSILECSFRLINLIFFSIVFILCFQIFGSYFLCYLNRQINP